MGKRNLLLTCAVAVFAALYFSTFWLLGPDLTGYQFRAVFVSEARILYGDFPFPQESIRPFTHVGYSAAISLAHLLGSSWYNAPIWVSYLSAVGLVVVIWVTTRAIGGTRAGWFALMFALLNPSIIRYSTRVFPDSLALLLFALFGIAIWLTGRSSSWGWCLTSGLLGGLYTLTRPDGFVLVPYFALPLAVMVYTRERESRKVLAFVGTFLLVSAVIVSPKLAHLYDVNGKFGLVFDTRFLGTGITGMQILEESYYKSYADLPPGTQTSEGLTGILGDGSLRSRVRDACVRVVKIFKDFQNGMVVALIGLPALLFLLIPFTDPSDRDSKYLVGWYMLYLCTFAFVMIGILALRDWRYGAPEYGARYFRHIVPPAIILGALGAEKVADSIAWRFSKAARMIGVNRMLALFGLICALFHLPGLTLYLHGLEPTENNPDLALLAQARCQIEGAGDDQPQIVATDDALIAYELGALYLPVSQPTDTLVAYMQKHNAKYLALIGVPGHARSEWQSAIRDTSANNGFLEPLRVFQHCTGKVLDLYQLNDKSRKPHE